MVGGSQFVVWAGLIFSQRAPVMKCAGWVSKAHSRGRCAGRHKFPSICNKDRQPDGPGVGETSSSQDARDSMK